ncbi:hypothetical protein STEG23_033093, partial [Scotinomys teguina]
ALQGPLFWLVLLVYLITLLGNSVIIFLTQASPVLRSPMYFFLGHLSVVELLYTTDIVPRILADLTFSYPQTISFWSCAAQMYFFIVLGISECCLLTAMAYDRYAAICQPLHYSTLMNQRACAAMVGTSWIMGIITATTHSSLIFTLPFPRRPIIPHFLCDILPVLRLASAGKRRSEISVMTATVVFIMIPFSLIVTSYARILGAILAMASTQSRHKVFSTCSSHLLVVSLFFGTASITYIRPRAGSSVTTDRILSLFYTVVTPMLNPIIYTLRNKEVKEFTSLMQYRCSTWTFLLACTDELTTDSMRRHYRKENQDYRSTKVMVAFQKNTWLIEQMVVGGAVLTFIITFVCVIFSYVYIIKTILRFPSVKQRKKAFSTCSSHMIVVSITYLYNISTGDKTITYNNCAIQIFFTDLFGVTEFFLLAIMSYDRYVAICKPLHYVTIMNSKICKRLIFCCWAAGLLVVLPPLSLGLNLEFCDSNVIDHFVCDASPLLKISCTDTWLIEQMVIVCAVLTFIMTLVCVVLSYVYIIRTIIRFPSAQQRKKAFSTCSSHMIVVSITYGSCIFIYVKPSAKDSVAINKGVTVLTTSIAPMLNPFIYTLRNKQVKEAFSDSVKRIALFFRK